MRYLWVTLAAVVSFALPQHASALIIVDYAFDHSVNTFLEITSPVSIKIPPQGTLDGQIQVVYTSDSSGNIIDGPATLNMFDISSVLNISTTSILGPFTITSNTPVTVSLNDPVAGSLAGALLSFGGASGSFHGAGTIRCTGSPCGVVNLPNGSDFSFDSDRDVVMPTLTIGSLHGTISGFNIAGVSVTLHFDASELPVPEPGVTALVALAAALVALRRARA
jgi:hypothetical protein